MTEQQEAELLRLFRLLNDKNKKTLIAYAEWMLWIARRRQDHANR